MGVYEQREKELNALHNNIVNDINNVLKEKGYKVGDIVSLGFRENVELMYDRTLVNNTHTDHLSVNELLNILGNALRVIPAR